MDSNIHMLLQHNQLSHAAAQLEKLALPSIRMISTAIQEDRLAIGSSKLGGHPDLPPTVTWPTWRNIPLAFLLQINLAEAHAFDVRSVLPAAGMLYFFYDADHEPIGNDPTVRDGWKVLYYHDDLSLLQRKEVPKNLSDREPTWLPDGQYYDTCTLAFSLEMALPPADSLAIRALQLSTQERDGYWQVLADLEEQRQAAGPLHHLLGYPDALQGDMQVQSHLVSHGLYYGKKRTAEEEAMAKQLVNEAYAWQLLLQLDTDHEAKMLWAIEGRCYYWIQREALLRNDFEGTWFIMQWT